MIADPPVEGLNVAEYTVSELAAALKRTLEESYGYVRVRGEISGFKKHSSGHCYFALKDDSACVDAVCWRSTALRLSFKPEDGLEVVATGRVTTYPTRSKYQLIVDRLIGDRKNMRDDFDIGERRSPYPCERLHQCGSRVKRSTRKRREAGDQDAHQIAAMPAMPRRCPSFRTRSAAASAPSWFRPPCTWPGTGLAWRR